jgi:hypothetical protein
MLTPARFLVVLNLSIIVGAGCYDDDDLVKTDTHPVFQPPDIHGKPDGGVAAVTQSLVNPGLYACQPGSFPSAGWVQINKSENGYDGDDRCIMIPPNSAYPNIHNGQDTYSWPFGPEGALADNIGNFQFYIPANRCVRMTVWENANYGGGTDSWDVTYCNPPGNGLWSAGAWGLRYQLGVGVSSFKTAYCEYSAWGVCGNW